MGVPTLFGDDDDPDPPILRPGELSSTPCGTLPRDVTRISGPTLERARQAVEVLRQSEDPELGLMGFVDAVVRLIVEGGDSLSRAPVVELVTALYR